MLLALAETGLPALAAEVERQVELGRLLRERLASAGFRVLNDTPLPIVCFAPEGASVEALRTLAVDVQRRGRAWVSFAVEGGAPCLRAMHRRLPDRGAGRRGARRRAARGGLT